MLKVLIAEDSVILADILEEFLSMQGYDVCALARTVEEAIWLADHCKPDLAVIDFRLADGGYGSSIRPRLTEKNIGILYVSGDPLKDRLTKEDGDAYLKKPYTMQELMRALHIVREIKANKKVHDLEFPKGFYLLENPSDENWRAVWQ